MVATEGGSCKAGGISGGFGQGLNNVKEIRPTVSRENQEVDFGLTSLSGTQLSFWLDCLESRSL